MTSIKNKTARFLTLVILAWCGLVSTGAAETFAPVENDISDNITGVDFITPDTGFLVTQGGQVGITYDGGRIWRTITIESLPVLEDVSFLDGKHGLVCGRGGALFETTDGGRHWENRSLKDTIPWVLSVQWVDRNHAVAVGMTHETESPLIGFSLVTADGGKTWTRQESMGLGYGELFLAESGPVYFQSFGKLHMSRNGGQTWRTVSTLDGTPGRVTAIEGRVGILAGAGGRIMYSHDNGKTWTDAETEKTNAFTCLKMLNADTGYVAGLGGLVMKTTDGGETWAEIELDTSLKVDIYDMAIAGRNIFLVGQYGTILRARIP